jgi:hypothetical protein
MAKRKTAPTTRTKGTTEWKIRVKPEMLEQLEQAAKDRGVSINTEMVERLRASFDSGATLSLWRVKEDMRVVWERFGGSLLDRDQFQKTIRAAYVLLKVLPPEMQKTAAVTELTRELAASEVSFRQTTTT